jgi:hypothetical protein
MSSDFDINLAMIAPFPNQSIYLRKPAAFSDNFPQSQGSAGPFSPGTRGQVPMARTAASFILRREAETGEPRTPVSPRSSIVGDRRSRSAVANARAAPRLSPARVTQSSTSSKSTTEKQRRAYFFFRVFFAPFFIADFVFVFRFFAILPS